MRECKAKSKFGLQGDCTNYREISLLCLPGKGVFKLVGRGQCPEKKCREIVESELEDDQCCFRPGRSTMEQIFTLKQSFEKSWEYAENIFVCFGDLEKACDRVL